MSFTELELIQWIKNNAPVFEGVEEGIGDDCAVLDYTKDEYQLFKVDAIAEGIHFLPDVDPFLIGRKALARPLSDIAAMGGIPKSSLISLAIDNGRTHEYIKNIFRGIFKLANEFGLSIAGGDTIRLKEGVVVSVSLLGTVNKNRICKRNGAKQNDRILVTGKLGKADKGKHLTFTPRINEANWLVENFKINSMIDISDGLIGDLLKLLDASHAGAKIKTSAVPLDLSAGDDRSQILKNALMLGEEFELLFTCTPNETEKILNSNTIFDTELSVIGEITDEINKVFLVNENGDEKEIIDKGFDHFVSN